MWVFLYEKTLTIFFAITAHGLFKLPPQGVFTDKEKAPNRYSYITEKCRRETDYKKTSQTTNTLNVERK